MILVMVKMVSILLVTYTIAIDKDNSDKIIDLNNPMNHLL